MTLKHVTQAFVFWPAVYLIRAGIALASLSETPLGRISIRPLFRVFCGFFLYARPFIFLGNRSQSVLPTTDISGIIRNQRFIAVIPCACRAGRTRCAHPLHTPHESDVCVTLGLAAVLQVGSGLGKRIEVEEAQSLIERAADSGLVHHVIYSMGQILEICNCCPETCAAIKAYRSGIPEAVRPSEYLAVRGQECNSCSGLPGRTCVELCPYGKEPSNPECLGCGLCARHCPQNAIHMIPRTGVSASTEGIEGERESGSITQDRLFAMKPIYKRRS